jgi:hypothetical protein
LAGDDAAGLGGALLRPDVPEFEREVAAGRLSAPVVLGGDESWSRAQLDEDLARILGRAPAIDDWRRQQPGLQHG